MDGPRDYHTKWSQTTIVCYDLYMKSKKKDTNEFTHKTEMEKNLWLPNGKEG